MTEKWIDHLGNEQEPGVIKMGDGLWLRRLGDDGFELSDFDPALTTTVAVTTTISATTTVGATTTEGATTTAGEYTTCGFCGVETARSYDLVFNGTGWDAIDGVVFQAWQRAFPYPCNYYGLHDLGGGWKAHVWVDIASPIGFTVRLDVSWAYFGGGGTTWYFLKFWDYVADACRYEGAVTFRNSFNFPGDTALLRCEMSRNM